MATINFYNTLTRQLEEFKPIKKGRAGLYTCGPTVYNYAHLGNLRTYIFEDVLKRVLVYNGYRVKNVMNITDVGHLTSDADEGEDKMEKGARREGKTAWEIADFYTAEFLKDLAELNIGRPDLLPRATEHIKEQITLVKKLEKNGFTYRTVDGIYFDTSKLPGYGRLANLAKQKLRAGVRVDIGDKRHPTDFALWKFSPPLEKRQMEWPSPWGTGFPGWHLECSAMSTKYLGQPFDLHCGGIDHVPVHHTNEIAQSEAAAGKPLANYWLHGEFLVLPGGKMAKSADNFITLRTLTERGLLPLAYRYFVLQTHYRKPLTFDWRALRAAQNGLQHLYQIIREWTEEPAIGCAEFEARFLTAVNNDLNLPEALAITWELIKSGYPASAKKSTLFKFDEVLGLGLREVKAEAEPPLPAAVQTLVKERDAARAAKDWGKSDALRQRLERLDYEVRDTKEGTKVVEKNRR
ncbi:MAG: cysteine--tRNA ligase [Candidatus Magasanikbacteria bacterium]|nr:cysteine--tRNA ligase [Candidatus Magasanikbacteria bacterium]